MNKKITLKKAENGLIVEEGNKPITYKIFQRYDRLFEYIQNYFNETDKKKENE